MKHTNDNPTISLKNLDKNRISVTNQDGISKTYYIGKNKNEITNKDSSPVFSFNLFNIDSSLYRYKYKYNMELPLGISAYPPLLGDANKNGKAEYYGRKKGFNDIQRSVVICYEQDVNGVFTERYNYDSTYVPLGFDDVDNDGKEELEIMHYHKTPRSSREVAFYRIDSLSKLPTDYWFGYNSATPYEEEQQIDYFTINDFDKDSINEAVYITVPKIHIIKYSMVNSSFDSVLTYETEWEPMAGFSIGDFDLDNSVDIIYSSGLGKVHVLEKLKGGYELSWQGNAGITNCHINFQTHDINNNGKPEFWIGGQEFDFGSSKLVAYETDGNNSYHPIVELNFPGLCSFFAFTGGSVDVDGDGVEEVYINVGNKMAVIKSTGTTEMPDYELYYYNDSSPYQMENMSFYQFPGERYPSLIFSMSELYNGYDRLFSRIYKNYLMTDIENESPSVAKVFKLNNAYPNPFNPSTNISFLISEMSNVKLKVYNSLGEEIVTLINAIVEKGEHSTIWNGKDKNNNSVPGGIYFIRMEAGNLNKTIKAVLLK